MASELLRTARRLSNEMDVELLSAGRRTIKAVADAILPSRLFVCRGPARGRRLALTFDDGPDELTTEYLDILDAYGVKATFFLIGNMCALRPEGVEEIVRRGHEVGGHGYTHRAFSSLDHEELVGELENTAALLPDPGTSLRLVRPPKGAISLRALMTCASQGYTTVLWSHDSNDCRTDTAGELQSSVARLNLRSGDILLFHEGQRWTIDALPSILQRIREEGYELVTVGDLLDG